MVLSLQQHSPLHLAGLKTPSSNISPLLSPWLTAALIFTITLDNSLFWGEGLISQELINKKEGGSRGPCSQSRLPGGGGASHPGGSVQPPAAACLKRAGDRLSEGWAVPRQPSGGIMCWGYEKSVSQKTLQMQSEVGCLGPLCAGFQNPVGECWWLWVTGIAEAYETPL